MQTLRQVYRQLARIAQRDRRYKVEAYAFVMSALNHTLSKLERPRHVKGQELLEGIRECGLQQFGPMTRTVLAHWGVTSTLDVGHIVFNLVNASLLGKTDEDSLEDFRGGYDFAKVFDGVTEYRLDGSAGSIDLPS